VLKCGFLPLLTHPNLQQPIWLVQKGPYVVINQLIKSIGKVFHLEKSFTYILRGGKNLDPIKNDQDSDF